MKILITGTHFTPAIATIEQLKKITEARIVYAGRKQTLEGDQVSSAESQALPSLGVKFISIIAGRLQRDFTIYTIPSLLKIPVGLLQAFYIILSQKPDVILSFGGYVAVPLVIAGWFFSIPIIIHEQGLVAGLANKISSYLADKIAISFKGVFKGEKVILTGNPVRNAILTTAKLNKKRNLPLILIAGGNQGSHAINLAVEESLNKLVKIAVIYHQTGDSKYKDYERLHQKESKRYKVFKFLTKDWAKILAESDLVICRAGINTLTEAAYLGKPALLIPIANNEQRKNAKYFNEARLAKVLPQSQLSEETLIINIKLMLKDLDNLKAQAREVKKVIIPDAAKRLALETILLVKN